MAGKESQHIVMHCLRSPVVESWLLNVPGCRDIAGCPIFWRSSARKCHVFRHEVGVHHHCEVIRVVRLWVAVKSSPGSVLFSPFLDVPDADALDLKEFYLVFVFFFVGFFVSRRPAQPLGICVVDDPRNFFNAFSLRHDEDLDHQLVLVGDVAFDSLVRVAGGDSDERCRNTIGIARHYLMKCWPVCTVAASGRVSSLDFGKEVWWDQGHWRELAESHTIQRISISHGREIDRI